MADKPRTKTDGIEPTAPSLLQAFGPPGGVYRNGESVLILSPREYGILLRRWRAQGAGRENQVPGKLFGYRFSVAEKFPEPQEVGRLS